MIAEIMLHFLMQACVYTAVNSFLLSLNDAEGNSETDRPIENCRQMASCQHRFPALNFGIRTV